MNDLSYTSSLSDAAILKEIGEFVKSKRIDQNLTQDDVAEQAAISRSTLSLLERGDNIALSNLLKVLRVLDLLYVFDEFKVSPQISPIQLAKEDELKRKRASRGHDKNDKNSLGW
jgi:transcriptional regulator with XRE-family HTH domain